MKQQSFTKSINQNLFIAIFALVFRPIVVMILECKDAVAKNRKLMGATDPKKADEILLEKCLVFLLIKTQSMDLTL